MISVDLVLLEAAGVPAYQLKDALEMIPYLDEMYAGDINAARVFCDWLEDHGFAESSVKTRQTVSPEYIRTVYWDIKAERMTSGLASHPSVSCLDAARSSACRDAISNAARWYWEFRKHRGWRENPMMLYLAP